MQFEQFAHSGVMCLLMFMMFVVKSLWRIALPLKLILTSDTRGVLQKKTYILQRKPHRGACLARHGRVVCAVRNQKSCQIQTSKPCAGLIFKTRCNHSGHQTPNRCRAIVSCWNRSASCWFVNTSGRQTSGENSTEIRTRQFTIQYYNTQLLVIITFREDIDIKNKQCIIHWY